MQHAATWGPANEFRWHGPELEYPGNPAPSTGSRVSNRRHNLLLEQ
jgi:hypothetical protein